MQPEVEEKPEDQWLHENIQCRNAFHAGKMIEPLILWIFLKIKSSMMMETVFGSTKDIADVDAQKKLHGKMRTACQ